MGTYGFYNGLIIFDMMTRAINTHIFRAYDIRGLYHKDVYPELFYKIGLATGIYLKKEIKGTCLAVGNDIRLSSPPLVYAFVAGAAATGLDISFTGTTSFGQTLFKGWELHQDLIAFVTASHLPAEWNGIKFYYGDGVGLPSEELIKIREYTLKNTFDLVPWDKIGQISSVDPVDSYREYLVKKVKLGKKPRVALDCGGGSMTLSAPSIFEALGIDTVRVFCDPDPSFSQRPSDPKPANLTALVDAVKKHECDFGVAFDGDGDRSIIVDDTGKVLSADETGIIIGRYGFQETKGTVIVNVEVSKAVAEQLEPLGFSIKQIKVGHTFLTLEAKREQAPLGIESSGHLILPEYFLFDDAIVVPLKIAEILDCIKQPLSELVKTIPTYPIKKVEIACPDEIKFEVVDQLKHHLQQEYDEVNALDGVRVTLDKGWVLIRPSNTSPIIRLTTEGDTKAVIERYAADFQEQTNTYINQLMKMK